jgi:hypothetical protein
LSIQVNVQSVNVLPDGRMDTKNTAIYSGLSEKTLAMMRSKGEGPESIKRGKVFYFIDKVDEWIKAGRRKTQ